MPVPIIMAIAQQRPRVPSKKPRRRSRIWFAAILLAVISALGPAKETDAQPPKAASKKPRGRAWIWVPAIFFVVISAVGPGTEILKMTSANETPQNALDDGCESEKSKSETRDEGGDEENQGSKGGGSGQGNSQSGTKSDVGDGTAGEDPPASELATLVPEDPAGLRSTFGRSRFAMPQNFYLKLSKGTLPPTGTTINVFLRPLEREEVDGEIGVDAYTARARVTGRKEVEVHVCIDSANQRIDPGTYVGGVRLEDPRIEDVTVPISVTLQHRTYIWWLISFAAIILVAGTFFVWASSQRSAGTSAEVTVGAFVRGLPKWLPGRTIAFALGVIGAASAFIATYWRNPAWGARAPEDWFTLLGAMFAAFTAGLTAGSAAGSAGSSTNSPQAKKQDDTGAGA